MERQFAIGLNQERTARQKAIQRTGLVTLLFTDMVESTALKQKLGDKDAAELFRNHHALLREILLAFPHGEEIETAGDSFLLTFATPSDAVQFALITQARLRTLAHGHGVSGFDRIGIHVGEVVVDRNAEGRKPRDLFGIQIDTCSRVMSLGKCGQTLMTRAVFDSARQMLKTEEIPEVSSLQWLNHGPYLLKGLDEAVEICEVREANQATEDRPEDSEKARRQVRADEELVLGWRPAVGQAVPNTRWVLERNVGEGGFGEVWVGRHQHTKERRVFKFCFKADRVRFLKRETTLFRLLKQQVGDHPNLVRLHDVFLAQPPFYLEMDYVAGADLHRWCAERGGIEKVPLEVRLEIVAQAAEGLQAAHDAGIIHRDVKPANILIDALPAGSQVRVKLTDFGIGQVVSEDALKGITRAGFTQTVAGDSSSGTGTHLYMAPELLAGKPASTRSDIYSLGVVLYQLLVEDFTQPVTTDWAEGVKDPLLREDLKLCLAGKPEDRFAGAAQLARQLRALPERQAERARQETEKARLERAAYRRGVLRTGLVALAVIAAFGLLSLFALRESTRARNHGEALLRNLYAADVRLASTALRDRNRGAAARFLSNYLHQAAGDDLRGWEWHYLWKFCQTKEKFPLLGHKARVVGLAYSPNSKELFSGGSDGVVKRWDLDSQKPLADIRVTSERRIALTGPRPWIESLAVSPDGETVVAGWQDGVAVCSGPSFTNLTRLEGAVKPVAISIDGKTLITGGRKGALVWDLPTRTQVHSLSRIGGLDGLNLGQRIVYSPDGLLVATVLRDGDQVEIKLWDASSLRAKGPADRPVTVLQRGTNDLTGVLVVAFSPDGKTLATGGNSRDLQLWDPSTGLLLGQLAASVGHLTFLPGGKKLISHSWEQDLQVWDISARTNIVPAGVIAGHNHEIRALAVAPDGLTFASGSKDGMIKVWPTSVAEERAPERDHLDAQGIYHLRFAPDGGTLLTASLGGLLQTWDARTLQPLDRRSLPGNVRLALISPQCNQAAVGLTNGALQLWSLPALAKAPQLQHELFSPQGSVSEPLFTAHNIPGATTAFPLVTWSADGKRVGAVLEADLHVWEAVSGKELLRRRLPSRPSAIALSPDGGIIALGLHGPVQMWDVATDRALSTCLGETEFILEIAFAPDGKTLAAGSLYNTAALWNVSDGKLRARLESHTAPVFHLAFSPDSRTLVTRGSLDSGLKLWHVATGRELLAIDSPELQAADWVTPQFAGVSFSPDGSALVAGLLPRAQIRFFRARLFK